MTRTPARYRIAHHKRQIHRGCGDPPCWCPRSCIPSAGQMRPRYETSAVVHGRERDDMEDDFAWGKRDRKVTVNNRRDPLVAERPNPLGSSQTLETPAGSPGRSRRTDRLVAAQNQLNSLKVTMWGALGCVAHGPRSPASFQPLDRLETDSYPRVNPLQDHLGESISLTVEVKPRLFSPLTKVPLSFGYRHAAHRCRL